MPGFIDGYVPPGFGLEELRCGTKGWVLYIEGCGVRACPRELVP